METLTPTTHTVDETGGGTVKDPLNAYDGDEGTYAALVALIPTLFCSETLEGFAADAAPGSRDTVTVRVLFAAIAWTAADDRAAIFFRATAATAWTNVLWILRAEAPVTATWIEVEVTGLAGSNPSTGFGISVQFVNDSAADPPFPQDP